MDIFIDKFAQRKNAQELIRANYMAEAEENEKLHAQIAAYDETLREIKAILESWSAEQNHQVGEALEQCQTQTEQLSLQIEQLKEKMSRLEEQQEQMKEQWEQLFKNAEDFNHKEAVKVYRNVQAAVEEQLTKQSQESMKQLSDLLEKKSRGKMIVTCGILTFAAVLANLTFVVLQWLGMI